MTKVFFFDAYPQIYAGAQRATLLSARALRDDGWEVEIVLPGDGLFADRLRHAGLSLQIVAAPAALGRYGRGVHGWRAPWAATALPRYWWKLRRVLQGVDLVHVNDHRGLVLAGPAARLAGVPFVWHTHGVLPPSAVNFLGRLMARRTIVLTQADANRLPGGRLRPVPDVVPNAPAGDFFEIVRRPADPPNIVTMARLNAVKGIDVLLQALLIVRRQRPDVTATILGGPQDGYADHAERLHRLRTDLGLESWVTFAGHRDRPDEVLAAASLYVQPSRWEGVPMAVLEAMAMGLPVVATRVGGLAEIIEHDVTGLLVPSGDPPALATAILRVLDTPELGARLGAAARVVARQRHSVEASVARLTAVYRSALA